MVITDLNLLSVEELETIANVLGVFTVIENCLLYTSDAADE